jgi:hypothetical protein
MKVATLSKKGGESMKQIAMAVFALLSIFINPSLAGACTSFAVYSNHTVYGMNFDYKPNLQQIFSISSEFQGKVFHLRPIGFGKVAGMNMKGLFAACLGLIPDQKAPPTRSKNQISTWIFHQMTLSRFEQVSQVKDFLNKKQVVQAIGTSMHNLVADRFGNALVVESGNTDNRITENSDPYMVMTNFPIYLLQGKNYEAAEGIGSERYKIAHRYIKANFRGFDIEKGMEVLKLAQNKSKTFTTRCSMVFDPLKKEIFICLEGNFDRIWKVSLENHTIETFRGFASFKREPLPSEGLLAADLAQW